ncbi:MAG TPA: FG-GAP repeat protein, partial [Nannocystis sp.]
MQLTFSQIKQFDFSWPAAAGATFYQLREQLTGTDDFIKIEDDIVGESISLTMPLHLRFGAKYILSACNDGGCADSEPLEVMDSMAGAVGYFKASNTEGGDYFGYSVALSSDGTTLAVGAQLEDSNATGVGGYQADNSSDKSGAVYVFVRSNGAWEHQAYVKASNTGKGDQFGRSVALSADGVTLAVGASLEGSGAVYVFTRSASKWSQQTYLKASQAGSLASFGTVAALSADGDTLVVGAHGEGSIAVGIDGDEGDDSAPAAGAAYVFVRSNESWTQQAYI